MGWVRIEGEVARVLADVATKLREVDEGGHSGRLLHLAAEIVAQDALRFSSAHAENQARVFADAIEGQPVECEPSRVTVARETL